jgi:hypothetical protein
MVEMGVLKAKHVPITSNEADFVILVMLGFDVEGLGLDVRY